MLDLFGIERPDEELRRWDELWLETMLGTHGWQPLAQWEPYPLAPVPVSERGGALQMDWITKHIPVPGVEGILCGGSVMEVGSGLGRIARLVARQAERYAGLDVSRFAVTLSRGRFANWPAVDFFHTVDDREHDFGQFALVFAVSVLIHFPLDHTLQALRWLYDRVAPGGWLSVDAYVDPVCGAMDHPKDWIRGKRWQSFGEQDDAIQDEMVRLGLQDVHVPPLADAKRCYIVGRRPE